MKKKYQSGGTLPGAVGNMYARENSSPTKKYKKKKYIAQDGTEIVQDDMGYWNPENWGKPVKINSNQITMKGIKKPLKGISDTGDTKVMMPGQDYHFQGNSVTELPMSQWDGMVEKADGSIGMWGNDWKSTPPTSYRMYPQGNISEDDINYLKTLNDNRVNKALTRKTNNQYGEIDSDMFKQLLKKRAQNGANIDQYINAGTDVLQGLSMLKGQKQAVAQANQMAQLTGVQAQAINSLQNDPMKRNYVRPEDITFQPNQMFPSYGTGTDILSAQNGGEIKEYQNGGNIYNVLNNGKFGDFMNSNGNDILNSLNPYVGHVNGQMPTAGNKIGGGIGQAAGTFFGGPIGGAIGKFAGNAIGGLIDTSDNKIQRYEDQSQQNINNILGGYVGMGIHNQNKAFMQNGGEMNYAMGGELQTYDEGGMETLSENPFLPNGGQTVEFKGASHEDGGIPMSYGNSPVEVEGGEPATKINDNLVIFGNLKIPNQFVGELGKDAKGKKFKNYIKDLSYIEDKQNKLVNKSIDETNNLDVITSFDKLKLTSLNANITGANMKLKNIATKKEIASHIQSAINDTAQEYNLDADELAQGKYKKAKNGMNIAQNGAIFGPSNTDIGSPDFIPEGANINRKDFNYLQDLYNKAQQQKTGPVVKKFQEEFSRIVPNIAKNVLGDYPTTNYGKSFNPDLPNTDLQSNYDGIFGKRTERYHTDMNPYGDAISPINTKIFPSTGFNYPNIESQPINNPYSPIEDNASPNKNKFPYANTLINTLIPYLRPSNKQNLDPNQLTGELYALSQNQLEGVPAQSYTPDLSTPYDISYQDQLNANQSDFNSIQRQVGNNPEALSSLAGQKYNANSRVLGEQFRQNQVEKQRVYEGNRNILNDSKLKNLQIYDNQSTRQAQAKSNTKAITQSALNSISSKIAQNKLENRTLQTYENLYNYRYDNSGRAVNMNGPAVFNTSGANNIGTITGPDGKTLYPQWKDGKFQGYAPQEKATIDEKVSPVSKAKKRNGDIVKAIKNL